MTVYPLLFTPILKPKIWGGRRLQELFGKQVPGDEHVGESWEVADLPGNESIVRYGPHAGRTLAQMMDEWGPDLTGRASLVDGRFPLLIKFLDARVPLSVQVHPDEAASRRLGETAQVKHEAWYVIEAEEGACIYRGLAPGVTVDDLRDALAAGRVVEALNRIEPRKGHCYYLPSGTVHALGGGIVVAEVQTPSDCTFRLYDWDRLDPATGSGRELHVDEALSCVIADPIPPDAERKHHVASVWTSVTHMVRCESFLLDRVRMVAGVAQPIPAGEMAIWIVLEGGGSIRCKGSDEPVAFGPGDTILIPAGLEGGVVETPSGVMWLEASVPVASALPARDPGAEPLLGGPSLTGPAVVPLNVARPDSS